MLKLLLLYCGGTVLGFLLWCLLFYAGALNFIEILFYRGVLLAACASLLLFLIVRLLSAAARVPAQPAFGNAFAIAALAFALNTTFLIVLPVTFDRSVTVFLLGELDRRGGATQEELIEALHRTYVDEYGAVERRMWEQIRSGNVRRSPAGDLELTPRGEAFVEFGRSLTKVFSFDGRFLARENEPESSTNGAVSPNRPD